MTVLLLLFQTEFLFSFISLIAVTMNSKIMLNNSDECGTLIYDLRGNGFSFSGLIVMFVVGLSYMIFIMLM